MISHKLQYLGLINIESIHSRSACWPTRLFKRNSPFTFAPWLPFLFHQVHWDQTEESLCPSLGSRSTLAQGPSAHVPLLFGTTFHYLSVQPPQLSPSEDVSEHTCSTWPFPPKTPVCHTVCWCYGTASTTSHLNTDLAVAPLSLATPGILAL